MTVSFFNPVASPGSVNSRDCEPAPKGAVNKQKKENVMKTIDIQAREWFDKTYGNSYFSAIVTLDYGMESVRQIKMPFRYGYGDYYKEAGFKELQKLGIVSDPNIQLWKYCNDNNIILRCNIERNCLKREVINYTK